MRFKPITKILAVGILILSLTACGSSGKTAAEAPLTQASEKNGDIYVLFTSDVHSGIDKGFGYAGLYQIRKSLEDKGYETILVDDGDSVQGEVMAIISKGEIMVKLMNDLKYDVAIPGNHEFDYGMEQFLKIVDMADFPYISCNFNKEGELMLPPYVIKEAAGKKIAFVGVTTPSTFVTSNPNNFKNDKGEFIYGFMQDETGEKLYAAVQSAVDSARKEGADYVYLVGHLGMGAEYQPWTYADVVSHTNGINVVLDGHSHDTEQVVMKNKDGNDVARSGCGTKLNAIGYSHISGKDGSTETGIWSWPNEEGAGELLSISNEMSDEVAKAKTEADETMNETVARSLVDLTINDPVEKDKEGNPIRIIRIGETNMGDFCADALRIRTGADVALINGGGIRDGIGKGDITYGDIISVFPFGNNISVAEVTGQQILDSLEWGVKSVPAEDGALMQVSGLTYEVDMSIDTPALKDENSVCTGFSGPRRVKNVMVGNEKLDPEKKYTAAGTDFHFRDKGDGSTAFVGAKFLETEPVPDSQLLIDFIVKDLKGTVDEEYADPYGQDRIKIY